MKRKNRFVVFLFILLFLPHLVFAESATSDTIPQPTLQPDAPKYDEEHPEDLVPEQLYAASAILIAQDTGEVIFQKEPDTVRPPASMTKIITVLLGIMMVDDLYETVTVSDSAVALPDGSSTMHLIAGEEIRFIDVLYGTMLLSGNDGANVIAETVSGDIPRFVNLMNETAAMFGCENTHFVNAHGYHDEYHYSTARDIALIARQALQNDVFREIASTATYVIPRTNKQRARTITTKSEYMLAGSEESPNQYYYPYATGIKTGSHSQSGYCFAGSAEKDGVSLISVVMFTGRKARWADTIKLMNYGFSQYMSVTPLELYNMNPITIETNNYSTSDINRGKVDLICREPSGEISPRITATKAEIQRMAANLKDYVFIQYTRDFAAPIEAGEQIGTMSYFPPYGDPIVYSLVASRSVAKRENAPKTLEQIIEETNADPNPFPPMSVEFVLVLILFIIIISVVIGLPIFVFVTVSKRKSKMKSPKPKNRYLK